MIIWGSDKYSDMQAMQVVVGNNVFSFELSSLNRLLSDVVFCLTSAVGGHLVVLCCQTIAINYSFYLDEVLSSASSSSLSRLIKYMRITEHQYQLNR